ARERSVSLAPEVVVQSPRVVALDDEDRRLRLPPPAGERLGRLLRVALALVVGELRGHLGSFALPRGAALALLLRPLDRLPERGHQVDDLALLFAILTGLRDLAGLRLLLQEGE